MVGYKGPLARATASVFVVGSLLTFVAGAQAQERSAAETAAHGAAVSRPLPDLGIGLGGGASASDGTAASSGTGAPSASHASGRPSRADVRAAQAALNAQGANLKVDGRLGPNTRRALMDHQAQHGLPVTGRLDSSTAASLGL